MTPVDQVARDTAINISKSYVVSAPAGSGKTGLLTLRVLKLLSAVKKPEEILCFTFTNKAANEMHERVLSALLEARPYLNIPFPESISHFDKTRINIALKALQQNIRYNWNLLSNPKRLQIMTIDSFSRSITNQLPISSKIGTQSEIESLPYSLYREAVLNYFEYIFSKQDHSDIENILDHLDGNIDHLADFFIDLLANRDQWLPILYSTKTQTRAYLTDTIQHWFLGFVKHTFNHIKPFESELLSIIDYAANNLIVSGSDSTITRLAKFDRIPEPSFDSISHFWQPLVELLFTSSGLMRKKLTRNEGFPPEKNAPDKKLAKNMKSLFLSLTNEMSKDNELCEHLLQLKRIPTVIYNDHHWFTLESLISELPKLVAFLKLTFTKNQALDFTEVSQCAINAFNEEGEISDIAMILDYEIKHILVDEFQDTSYVQLNLLRLLTQQWQPNGEKTLFIVGDAMQSCYAFRNANVGIFLNIKQNGLPSLSINPLQLIENFRSSKEIVTWVNRVFEQSFPAESSVEKGSVSYSKAHAFNKNVPDSYVKIFGFSNEEEIENEYDFISKEVQNLNHAHPEDSIAILVKNRTHLKWLANSLTSYKVDYEAVEMNRLVDKPIIIDLTSILRAWLNIGDRIAWLAVLRAQWCGLSLATLHDLCQYDQAIDEGESYNIWTRMCCVEDDPRINAADKTRIIKVRQCFQRAFNERARFSLSQIVESIWVNLGGHYSAKSEGDLNDASVFFQLIARQEKYSQLKDWTLFEKSLNELYAEPQAQGKNPVKIMTMHKSKGLEFDTVFLPGLHRSSKSEQSKLINWLEIIDSNNENHFILSPVTKKNEKETDSLTKFIRQFEQGKKAREETRLLYVACTRARKRLYLTAEFDENKVKQNKHKPAANSMLSKIWSSVKNDIEYKFNTGPIGDRAENLKTSSNQVLTRLPVDITIHNFPDNSNQVNSQFDNSNFDSQSFLDNDEQARHIGIGFHYILSFLAQAQEGFWYTIVDHIQWIQRAFLLAGCPTLNEEKQVFNDIKINVDKLMSDNTAKWVLNSNHEDSESELEIYHSEHGQLIIDRTFISEDNVRWIIDYKTTKPNTNQPIPDFIREQEVLHKTQLERYADVFSSEQRSVKKALYFPFICQLAVIE